MTKKEPNKNAKGKDDHFSDIGRFQELAHIVSRRIRSRIRSRAENNTEEPPGKRQRTNYKGHASLFSGTLIENVEKEVPTLDLKGIFNSGAFKG